MEKYNAWIKELSTIVYDNSKSEYQILSELIPILLNIKSSQDTNSELMDTIHDTVFTKVSELESGMNTFTETFTQKLNEFRQEFNSGVEEFTTTLESNINEFKEKINNKISSFNKTYASEKASIQDIANSINNINDTLISGYNEIINKINNFVEPIINSASGNIIDTAIEEKFTPTYLARESIYIDLVSVTTAPSSANEGDIYYNASEYQLYKYTGSAWVEEDYTTNKLYRFQNNLYHIDMIRTDKTNINYLNQNNMIKGRGDTFIGTASTYGKIIFNINNINGGSQQVTVTTYPENWTDTSSMSLILYDETNDIYYMEYNHVKIATSQDLINWTFLTDVPDRMDNIFIANGTLYCGRNKYVNNEWVNIPGNYIIVGYADNKFWRVDLRNEAIYTATSDDFSDEELYCTSPYSFDYNFLFYYNNGLLKIGNAVFYNKEYIFQFGSFLVYGNSKCNFVDDYIVTNNSNVLIQKSTVDVSSVLQYDDNYTIFSFDNGQTNRYILRVGLVPYE